ncbi:hypothetical protein O9Z70_15745 [Devosia sp. YIM 151766]|uniref:hypothetical protein n=1 Tax=Devosia sp. YIM 151766 TaxID=3017325 RepID=UPI00255D1019|nr:hypothetical protein [Devosia sp. YIM 151766]WIY52884.1 hypothetical protein O9Z70_15745 [Devosia sp. YIM 151766]
MAGATAQLQMYQRLARRNRFVAMLRLGIPAMGLVVLAGLMVQIYLASFTGRFGVGRIEVTPETIIVDAPEYAGILSDGSAYRVWAETAQAHRARTDLIALSGAHLVIDRVDGVQLQIDAAAAQLDMAGQITTIPELADIADSTGMTGTLTDSVFDWEAQTLNTKGAVSIDNADGSTVRAEGLVYDAEAVVWTFSRAVVTLPIATGEKSISGPGD